MAYPNFPDTIYVDTSFLIELLTHPKHPSNRIATKCKNLYDHLISSDTELVASLFTLQETIHVLFFKYKLSEEAENRGYKGYNSIKKFRQNDLLGYQDYYNRFSFIPGQIYEQIKTMGLIVKHPNLANPILNANNLINEYVITLLKKYQTLDSCDAYHVAIARLLEIDCLVSCDKGFSPVTEISTFNPLI